MSQSVVKVHSFRQQRIANTGQVAERLLYSKI